jgi:hypothetical protein
MNIRRELMLCLTAFALAALPSLGYAKGWYLIDPPTRKSELLCLEKRQATSEQCAIRLIDLDAPLSKWEQVFAFDSANECELSRVFTLQLARERQQGLQMNSSPQEQYNAHFFRWHSGSARCISMDDPRLTPGKN